MGPHTPTVLVVEDEMLLRFLGVDIFSNAGFHVIEAVNADEALEILGDAVGVHVLFTDVTMPGSIDGLTLARHVVNQWPHIAIIIVSGAMSLETHELPPGAVFHRKPYDPQLVVQHARELTAHVAKRHRPGYTLE
jgi:DNA-binding NtrC family response regulator